jgi:hypothetical protein
MAIVRREEGRKGEEPRWLVRLDAFEHQALATAPERLRALLLDPSKAGRVVDRLFPPAHSGDPKLESEHRELIGHSLYEERIAALREFQATLERHTGLGRSGGPRLSRSEVRLWLHVINDLRLLIATELDITDNEWSERGPSKPEDAFDFELLLVLTGLQSDLLEAAGG